jgi:hypothetical protein
MSKPKMVEDLKLRAMAEECSVADIIRRAIAAYLYRGLIREGISQAATADHGPAGSARLR